MIRFIIAILFVVVFLILSIPTWGVLFIIGLFDKKKKELIGFRIVQKAFFIIWKLCGVKPEIKGLENVPTDEPVLFIGNHQSYLDIILTYSLCPNITGYLSKADFSKIPLLNIWMKKNYCLFLTRDNPREDLKIMIKAIDYVKAGISMFVFPEGTRSKNGEIAEFHEAPMRLSTKTGCKVVPVAINGGREILENRIPFIKSGKVTITYLAPIDIKSLEGDDKKFPAAYCKKLLQEELSK